jgi:hypothetical protein
MIAARQAADDPVFTQWPVVIPRIKTLLLRPDIGNQCVQGWSVA